MKRVRGRLRKEESRRGQFFLMLAVIVIFSIAFVIREYNTIKKPVALEDFDELSEGYSAESPRVINEAIFSGSDPVTELTQFSNEYVRYAREKEPSYGLFYAYLDEQGRVRIHNYLDDTVILVEGETVAGGKIDAQIYSTNTMAAPGLITLDILVL